MRRVPHPHRAPTMQTVAYRGHWLHITTSLREDAIRVQGPDHRTWPHVYRSLESAKRAIRSKEPAPC